MKILNFGSLNIDYVYKVDHFVSKGETLSSEALHVYSGGKGLNQSVALGRAGDRISSCRPACGRDRHRSICQRFDRLLAALLAGETVQQAMDPAARAAAVTVSRRGAAPAIPRGEELHHR